MAYVRPSDQPPIDRESLDILARLVGFTLPEEDIESLGAALRDQFAAAESLENLDLTDVTPAFRFDARWHD
jgi:Asp-tRNA(Asn)/Glu-tRNA(Gln) amidotransferase C subunit